MKKNKKQTNPTTESQDRTLGAEPDVTTKPKVTKVKVKAQGGGGDGKQISTETWTISFTTDEQITKTSEIATPITIYYQANGGNFIQMISNPSSPDGLTSSSNETLVTYPQIAPPSNPSTLQSVQNINLVRVAFAGDWTGNDSVTFEYEASKYNM